jgi:hypothetical protein
MVKAGEITRKGRGCYVAASKTPCDNGYAVTKGEPDEAGF